MASSATQLGFAWSKHQINASPQLLCNLIIADLYFAQVRQVLMNVLWCPNWDLPSPRVYGSFLLSLGTCGMGALPTQQFTTILTGLGAPVPAWIVCDMLYWNQFISLIKETWQRWIHYKWYTAAWVLLHWLNQEMLPCKFRDWSTLIKIYYFNTQCSCIHKPAVCKVTG